MQLIQTTYGYGYQHTLTAATTLRCLAPLMSRQDLAEVLSECVQAMQQQPRPKMALFVQSAEECAQKSLAAANDNEAVMWAGICLKECRQALSGLIPGAIETGEVESREQQAQVQRICQRVARHPDYLDYKPRLW